MKIYYNPKLKQLAGNLRNKSTLGEVLLRAKPIGHFIADFYCPNLKLVIEVDGC